MEQQSIDSRIELVCLAAQLILENGGETYRVEETAARMAKGLGLPDAHVAAFPTSIFVESGGVARLRRISRRGNDMKCLALTNDVSRRVERGQLGFLEAQRLLEEAAAARGRVYPVLLRLTAGTQFGMDEHDLTEAVARRGDCAHLRFEGLHYFSGTQRAKIDKDQRRELSMLAGFMDRLESEYGWRAEKLEYGPGLYVPYFAHEDFSDTLAPLRALAPDLAAMAQRCELTVEMGRFFASACGHYLTTVVDTKVNCGVNFAILDGGMHHVNYLGGMMGMRVPLITHIPGPLHAGEDEADWSLCGSLCTTADVLVRRTALAGLARGDVLAFHNIGAYSVTEGPALFLSRDMPRIILANGRGERLVRDTIPSSKLNQGNL